MSSNFQMFVQVLCKFVAFLVLYLSLLKIEEYQRKGANREQDSMILTPLPTMSSACLLPVENFSSQRISLIG